MHRPLKTLVYVASLGMFTINTSHSGGFSLYMEDNGYAVGNFAAGIAAEAVDASTGWYNPAGLVLIPQEIVGGGVGVFPVSKLSGHSTFTTTLSPGVILPSYIENFNGLKTSENAVVPSLHYALPLGERLTFGLSLVSPFGLATDWGTTSAVRYEATYTDLMTVNLSPQLGARITPCFSIGAGLDLQYAKVAFNRILGVPTALQAAGQDPTREDTLSDNRGSSFGVGFHAGILGMFNENSTRLGLNYQSKMNHRFHGSSTLSGYLASNGGLGDNPFTLGSFTSSDLFSNAVQLPDVLTLSGYQAVNERFALLASLVYTGWSVFDIVELYNVAAVNVELATITQGLFYAPSAQNYHDAWRVSLGANYCINSQWMLRAGGGFDQTPTNNIDRDMRLPDTNRWGVSIGSHYQFRPNLGFDIGFSHLFGATDASVNRTDPLGFTSTYTVNARGKNYANLFGAQFVWIMDDVEVQENALMK